MNKQPLTIGITGGIGSGKSYVCRLLEANGATIFYTDAIAKHIIRKHPQVQAALCELVGNDVYDKQGSLNKLVLGKYIRKGTIYSQQVDAIVHPYVKDAWIHFVQEHTPLLTSPIYMECALLFESQFDEWVDKTLFIKSPQKLRIQRVMQRDQVSKEIVAQWMQLQLPEEEKERRSDWIIINDEKADLQQQLNQLHLL